MTDARVSQEVVQVLHGGETSDANVSQEVIQVLHGGITSDARISQQVIQILASNAGEILFQQTDETAAYDDEAKVTTTNVNWCVLNSTDISTVTEIVSRGSDGTFVDGESTFITGAIAGQHIILVQDDNDRIAGYIVPVD